MFNPKRSVLGFAKAVIGAFLGGKNPAALKPVRSGSVKGGAETNQRQKKRSGGSGSGAPYVWGTLGLSAVSAAIQKAYPDLDRIPNRKERKQIARSSGRPFKTFIGGY
jgi:hypothetical protein